MTNKQERFYVVSESELKNIVTGVRAYDGYKIPETRKMLEKAEAACRARPVPEWAAGFCSEPIETSSDYPMIEQFQEIDK